MNEPNQEIPFQPEEQLVKVIHEEYTKEFPAPHYHLRADNPKLGQWLSIIPKMVITKRGVKYFQTELEACIFPKGRGKGTDIFIINREDMDMNTQDPEFWEELKKYGERFVKIQELNLADEDEVWKAVFPDIIEAREKRAAVKVR